MDSFANEGGIGNFVLIIIVIVRMILGMDDINAEGFQQNGGKKIGWKEVERRLVHDLVCCSFGCCLMHIVEVRGSIIIVHYRINDVHQTTGPAKQQRFGKITRRKVRLNSSNLLI